MTPTQNNTTATAYALLCRNNDGRIGIFTCPACFRDIPNNNPEDDANCRHAANCQPLQEIAAEPQLYDRLKLAGVPVDSHESDLYCKDTPEARAIIQEFMDAGKLHTRPKAFTSEIEPRDRWLDIPFMYAPFWRRKARR